MSPKKGERAAPPAGVGEHEIRFDDNAAAKGWDALCAKAKGNMIKAWQEMRTNPGPKSPTERHHQLKGGLATVRRNGEDLPQWQIEVTGGDRIWYLLDTARSTCWVRHAGAHPKATD